MPETGRRAESGGSGNGSRGGGWGKGRKGRIRFGKVGFLVG